MTTEPERTPPSGTGPAAARAADLLAERSLGDSMPVYGVSMLRSAYPVWQALDAWRRLQEASGADPNAPPDPWAEPAQSVPLADIVEAARLAREYSTPFGEEPAV